LNIKNKIQTFSPKIKKHFIISSKRYNIRFVLIQNFLYIFVKGVFGIVNKCFYINSIISPIISKNMFSFIGNISIWRSCFSSIKQIVKGVTVGYSLRFVLHAIVFKCSLPRKRIRRRTKTFKYFHMKLGFRHLISCKLPKYSFVWTNGKRDISIISFDKIKLQNFSIRVRHLHWPDIYKGKGIQYRGEIINFKPGKQR